MRATLCQLADDLERLPAAWATLGAHVRAERSDLVVLPELPAGRWFGPTPAFDRGVWWRAIMDHEALMGRLGKLGAETVLSSRPVEVRGGD